MVPYHDPYVIDCKLCAGRSSSGFFRFVDDDCNILRVINKRQCTSCQDIKSVVRFNVPLGDRQPSGVSPFSLC